MNALAEKLTGEIFEKLKKSSVQEAFQQAIGTAIHRYAVSGSRLDLAKPLLRENSPLVEPSVAVELSHIIRFERRPNAELIGQRWRASIDNPPQWRNFTLEAEMLIQYIETELRNNEVFRAIFDAKSFDIIASNSEKTSKSLAAIEDKLEGLISLLDSRFSQLLDKFSKSSHSTREQIYDFTTYIQEKTSEFVGRRWLFDSISSFIQDNQCGYLFIIGDPGIGKSTFAAQLVKEQGHVHHFNIRSEGVNKTATFLKNISAQLIAVYGLQSEVILADRTEDSRTINKLLQETSDKLLPNAKCVIVIDALDEVEQNRRAKDTNVLYLPQTLPKNVYIITTLRNDPSIKPYVECPQVDLFIHSNSLENLNDITGFVTNKAVKSGVQHYISTQKITTSKFVEILVEKSEGNFMYLHYMISAIEQGKFVDDSVYNLPVGLKNYYQRHWEKMKGEDFEMFVKVNQKVISVLATAHEPVSLKLVASVTKLGIAQVLWTVEKWQEFLHVYPNLKTTKYTLYHGSYRDFLAQKMVER